MTLRRSAVFRALALALFGLSHAAPAVAQASAANCPQLGWSEGLVKYQKASAPLPTGDTPIGAPDCCFLPRGRRPWRSRSFSTKSIGMRGFAR